MSSNDPTRLRGSASRRNGPYLLGQFPDDVLRNIGRLIVHRLVSGMADLTGDDFGTIFAEAIGGTHRARPLGIADVAWDGLAWSVKTVSVPRPLEARSARLISGRNSPDYSHGITDVRANIANTGRAVLSIWNARVNEALDQFNELRIVTMLRNIQTREFTIFEEEARQFIYTDYEWRENAQGNFEGFDRTDGRHWFTWQPSGSQFTVIRSIPGSAKRFSIVPNVPVATVDDLLAFAKYKPNWIQIHG